MNFRMAATAGVALALGLTAVVGSLPSLMTGGSAEAAISGDVNGDGRVNSLDASIILQFDAGLIPSVPSKPTATPMPTPCTYNGPYSFSGTFPEIAQTTSTFCLTEQRAILYWDFWAPSYYPRSLYVDLYDESANYVGSFDSIGEGIGSRSIQTVGPGYYFLEIRLLASNTPEWSWTLSISQ